MSSIIGSSLSELLKIEKTKYLDDVEESGGTAAGFRERVSKQYEYDPKKFNSLVLQALMEATTKTWQAPPRKHGPDLFSVAGFQLQDSYTRPCADNVTGDDIEADDEQKFEKVSSKFATVNDLYEDATITLRKGAQTSAAGERKMQIADAARSKARGNRKTLLRDIAD